MQFQNPELPAIPADPTGLSKKMIVIFSVSAMAALFFTAMGVYIYFFRKKKRTTDQQMKQELEKTNVIKMQMDDKARIENELKEKELQEARSKADQAQTQLQEMEVKLKQEQEEMKRLQQPKEEPMRDKVIHLLKDNMSKGVLVIQQWVGETPSEIEEIEKKKSIF